MAASLYFLSRNPCKSFWNNTRSPEPQAQANSLRCRGVAPPVYQLLTMAIQILEQTG